MKSVKKKRSLRPYRVGQDLEIALAQRALRSALEHAKNADCPALAEKIRSALKSADGANRHVMRRWMAGGGES